VANGKVYAAGSTHAHCVDAKTGKPVWSVKLPSKATASSFLVANGRAFIMAGRLVALDAETGREVWQSEAARGGNSSPMIWEHKGHQFIIISAGREVFCLNPSDGSVVWSVAGGGDSTPVIYGDWLVSYSRDAKIGLAGYKLSLAGAEMIWNLVLDARRSQSTPIIYQKHVYLAGGENQLCLELATGKVQWREKRQSTISSPLIADGKFILMEKKGSDLVMLEATPEAHREITKTRVKAMWCPSPVVSNGRLYLRRENHVVCFNLALRQVVP
jgi:outer membrane protein assembly factor BamB